MPSKEKQDILIFRARLKPNKAQEKALWRNCAIRSFYIQRFKLGVSNEDSICRVGIAARVLHDF